MLTATQAAIKLAINNHGCRHARQEANQPMAQEQEEQ